MGEIADQIIDQMMWDQIPARARKRKAPRCPKCGGVPAAHKTKYGIKRECCGLWGWGQYAPLVDAETHQARQYAHKVFDSLWQSGLVGRSEAYALLAQEMRMHPNECHMKLMPKKTAWRVPAAVSAISKRLRGERT